MRESWVPVTVLRHDDSCLNGTLSSRSAAGTDPMTASGTGCFAINTCCTTTYIYDRWPQIVILKLEIACSRLQIVDSELQNSDFKLRKLNSELQDSNLKLQDSDSKLQNVALKLQNSDSKLQTLDSKLQNGDLKLQNHAKMAGRSTLQAKLSLLSPRPTDGLSCTSYMY
jgi:division protein CdvB (Snf7/Vps24/ESCRT-III family)